MAYATTSQEIFSCFRTRFSCFYTISFDFGVTLILFTPNYTIDLHLHHSRYSFRQIHFWHLIFYMRHFCDMIVDIHSDLSIRMVFAPLRSVLNGCPPDIQHPITYCITFGLTLFSPNLVHPVWRRMCGCVKYRTKKILFFSAEDYLTLPSGSPSTFIIFW